MVHYFLAFALLLVPALAWTLITGLQHDGSRAHFNAGLFTAVLALAAHTLLILFMIVTGRVLKEAMRTRPLSPEFLEELNVFFGRKSAYPLAVFACFAIVAAAVLGNAQRGFGISPLWHASIGTGAALLNVWAIVSEYRALLENQALLDRAALALDRLDRERAAEHGESGDGDGEPPAADPRAAARWGRWPPWPPPSPWPSTPSSIWSGRSRASAPRWRPRPTACARATPNWPRSWPCATTPTTWSCWRAAGWAGCARVRRRSSCRRDFRQGGGRVTEQRRTPFPLPPFSVLPS